MIIHDLVAVTGSQIKIKLSFKYIGNIFQKKNCHQLLLSDPWKTLQILEWQKSDPGAANMWIRAVTSKILPFRLLGGDVHLLLEQFFQLLRFLQLALRDGQVLLHQLIGRGQPR